MSEHRVFSFFHLWLFRSCCSRIWRIFASNWKLRLRCGRGLNQVQSLRDLVLFIYLTYTSSRHFCDSSCTWYPCFWLFTQLLIGFYFFGFLLKIIIQNVTLSSLRMASWQLSRAPTSRLVFSAAFSASLATFRARHDPGGLCLFSTTLVTSVAHLTRTDRILSFICRMELLIRQIFALSVLGLCPIFLDHLKLPLLYNFLMLFFLIWGRTSCTLTVLARWWTTFLSIRSLWCPIFRLILAVELFVHPV